MDVNSLHVYHARAAEIAGVVAQRLPGRSLVACATEAELLATLPEITTLLAAWPPPRGFERARRLRLLHLMGAGADGLLPADLPDGVRVAGARGVLAPEVAEHAIALLLALRRGLPSCWERQRARRWQPFASGAIAGGTVVVLGLGAIGRRVAHAAASLGAHVLGVRLRPGDVPHVERVVGPDQLREALAAATVGAVVTLPLTEATRGLLDALALGALPEGALVVNVSRGAVIEEAALMDALRSGRLGGAALDVFEGEPLGPESPWWTMPNTLVTPHLGGIAPDLLPRVVERFVANVAHLDRGEPLEGEIDRFAGY